MGGREFRRPKLSQWRSQIGVLFWARPTIVVASLVAPARTTAVMERTANATSLPPSDPRSACRACTTGAHAAHTCGVRGYGNGGRRPRVMSFLPETAHGGQPLPLRSPAVTARCRAGDDVSACATMASLPDSSGADGSIAGTESSTAVSLPHASSGPASTRAEWSRSAALMRTHWLCRTCKVPSAKGLNECATCGAAAPKAASEVWKEVQRRRETNLARNSRAQKLSYFAQREQETQCLSAGRGALRESHLNRCERCQSTAVLCLPLTSRMHFECRRSGRR